MIVEFESALLTGGEDPLSSAAAMCKTLRDWTRRGWLRRVDTAFAEFLLAESRDASPLLILGAALASHQLGRGHACLDLEATLADPTFALSLPPDGTEENNEQGDVVSPAQLLADISVGAWETALDHPDLSATGFGASPLVVVQKRLYLRRYWQYERNVCANVQRRLFVRPKQQPTPMHAILDLLFPGAPSEAVGAAGQADWQKIACALATRSAFSIITGGPGTGKTTTVVRLLALLQALAMADNVEKRPLRIRLAAPTGKAAARLNESIAKAVDNLALAQLSHGDQVRAAIPTVVTTLHRLLGNRPGTRRFKHDATTPLSLDVLVIDEASMIDLEMLNAVLDALPSDARLILLGDKDQLASVEAGAVLGELCQQAAKGRFTQASVDWLREHTGQEIPAELIDDAGSALDQCVVMLRHSYRFSATSGIGQLADAVNAGHVGTLNTILQRGHEDLAMLRYSTKDDAGLKALVIDGETAGGVSSKDPGVNNTKRQGYRYYLQTMRDGKPSIDAPMADFDAWANDTLRAHGAFQLLCALRRGTWGVDGLNKRVARWLQDANLIEGGREWYLGRPILITRNDYELGLMNGDVGITLALPGKVVGTWDLRVAFPSTDGTSGVKWVSPNRLQAVETVFALTVHKSQGSEFAHAALVLPDKLNPILTRELIYTGITRAKSFLAIACAGDAHIIERAIQRRVVRASGLSSALR